MNDLCRAREFKTDVYTVQTNMPEELTDLSDTSSLGSMVLNADEISPAQLDTLPVGNYWQMARRDYDFVIFNKYVKIIEGPAGPVIDSNLLGEHQVYAPGRIARHLLARLGFAIPEGEDRYSLFRLPPTPTTLTRAAQKLGISVCTFPDHGVVPPEQYLECFKQGLYPVATKNMYWYKHDIQDDHITAMMLGSDTLRSNLQKVIQAATETGINTESYHDHIDGFTSTLRQIAETGSEESYLDMSIWEIAESLDMDPSVCATIVNTVCAN